MSLAHEEQQRRAADWHGLHPVTDTEVCPRVVAGRTCHASAGMVCVCQQHHHLLDHGRMWRKADGTLVLTGEPYDAGGRELTAFLTAMRRLSLNVSLDGRSPWHPGHTILLKVTAADAD